MQLLQALALVLAVASAALFTLVGRTVQRRDVSADARAANSAFVTWWYALAGTTVLGLGQLSGLLPRDVTLHIVLSVVGIMGICVALWGLMVYLVYLFTESRRLAVPLAVGYAGYFAFLLYFILSNHPVGVEVYEYGTRLAYETEIARGPLLYTLIVLLLGPPMVSALGYLSLYWRVDDPMLRRRILLVSLSILVWFGSSIAPSASAAEISWWPVASRAIGLAAAGTIYYAFRGLRPGASAASARPVAAPAVPDDAPKPPRGHVTRA